VLPGQQSTIDIAVKKNARVSRIGLARESSQDNANDESSQDQGDESYELCVFVVDQAVLDLAPVPLLRFNETDVAGDEYVNVCRGECESILFVIRPILVCYII
jgi:hypothetical protein